MKRLLLALFLLLVGSHVHAQIVTVNGQIRHRSEYDAKELAAAGDSSAFHLLRTRLSATARPNEHVSAFIQIQDSRMFGDEDPGRGRGTLDGDANQLDVHQAYLGVQIPGISGLSARVGRQEFVYGNQRLVGSVGWSNIGRTFDGAVLKLDNENVAADFFAAQLVGPDEMPGTQNLFGLFTDWTITGDHSVDVFALLDNDTNELTAGPDAGDGRLTRFTPGLRLHGSPDAFDYTLEAVYQTGNVATADDAARSSISAYLLGAAAGYSTGSARFGAGYTRLSGDDNPTDNESQTFNTLFATNHKFYGFMDYFPSLSGSAGLTDVELSVAASLSRAVRVKLGAHHFATAVSSPGVSSTLGQEIDVSATYLGLDAFQITAGASMFVPGDILETTLGSDATYWLYLTFMVSF